jgi:putative addiction module CopG family antidote
MKVALPKYFEKVVKEEVRSGRFGDAEEFIRHLIRDWDERRQREELAQFERLFPNYPQAPAGEPSDAEMDEINSMARKHRRRLAVARRRKL